MPVLTYPYVFANGTIADANQVNANFNAALAVINGIDYANVGPNGFMASQIIPSSIPQAIFGGTYSYTFPAGLLVTAGLTVGGGLTVAGATNFAGNVQVTAGSSLTVNGTVSAGTLTAATATITALTVSGTLSVNSLAIPGTLSVGVGTPGNTGDGSFARSVSSGAIFLGGTTSSARIDYGVSYAAQLTVNAGFNVAGGALTAWGTNNTQGTLQLGLTSPAVIDFNITRASWVTCSASFQTTANIASSGNAAFGGTVSSVRAGGGGTPGFVSPSYGPGGASNANTLHTVFTTVTATSATTGVTLSGAAVFSSINYFIAIYNINTGAYIAAGATTASSVQWASVNGQSYAIFLYGT